MRARCLGFVVGAAVALSGCATLHQAPRSDRSPVAGACADWRWIGITDSSATACPKPPWGWSGRPVFPAASKDKECGPGERKTFYAEEQEPGRGKEKRRGITTEEVTDELARFCVYEAESSWRKSPAPFVSPRHHGLVRLDRDCAAMSVAADQLTPADLQALSAQFFTQAGRPLGMNIEKQRGVRLAFVDTEPTGNDVPQTPGNAKHGYTLAHIAKRLVCSPDRLEACAAQITTRLALPILDFDAANESATRIDDEHGGGVGTQMDLAKAIEGEVNDWRADLPNKEKPQHLVLNLSLGWDPALFGGVKEERIADLQAGTQAVFRALQYAKSLDVLVVAAAGNKRDCCPQTKGPLLPAAWESGTPFDDADRDPADSPLVYAVGGIDGSGSPLANAREDGMPERAAIGENAVVTAWNPEAMQFSSTWLYTGSSVATAVVSSTAALVWDSFPNLDSAAVMRTLDDSGTPLTTMASFSSNSPSSTLLPAHKISVCTALSHACALNGPPCPLTSECDGPQIASSELPHVPPAALSQACYPWVVPQPDEPPCLPCKPPLGG